MYTPCALQQVSYSALLGEQGGHKPPHFVIFSPRVSQQLPATMAPLPNMITLGSFLIFFSKLLHAMPVSFPL